MNISFLIRNSIKELPIPAVMGIINLTDNSFYAKSRIENNQQLLATVKLMIEEGADIIDVGASSTRPGTDFLSAEEELLKLIPAIKILRKEFSNILLSVDTVYADVATACANAGADMINDISGGLYDTNMYKAVSHARIPYIMMHMQGTPKTMQNAPKYDDVITDINYFFSKQIDKAHQSGIHDIMIDPGFGFGKTLEHNYEILEKLDLMHIHSKPILVGLSRKSMIYKTLGSTPENALSGTIALNSIAISKGASILRVHDVKAAKDTIEVLKRLQNQFHIFDEF